MRHMRWMYPAGAGQFLAATLSITGCATTSNGPAVAGQSIDDDAAAQEVREHHRHHHHGGVTAFVALSLDSLGVPPEKKDALEKIQIDLAARLAPARDAEEAVLSALADGVAAGAIDQAKVDGLLGQLGTASEGVHDASREALNQLHSLLSPSERQALVAKVRAHWAVWRRVNHEEHPGSHERGSRVEGLTAELNLTPAQVTQIEQALAGAPSPAEAEAAAVKAHVEAFSTAFVADEFDAASLTTAKAANSHISQFGAARTARFYEAVTPILNPEQRTKLADHLRDHLTPKAS